MTISPQLPAAAHKMHTSAIIVHFNLWNKKRGLTLKVHAFLFERVYQILW